MTEARSSFPVRAVVIIGSIVVLAGAMWIGSRLILTNDDQSLASAQTTEFSFTYPASWAVLSGPEDALPFHIDRVVGTGSWQLNCDAGACGADNVDITGNRIVLKIYRLLSGPPQTCRGDYTADGRLGPNAVRVTNSGSTMTWEVPAPGAEFGRNDNLLITAFMSSATQRALAEMVVGSVRWRPGFHADPGCPSPTS